MMKRLALTLAALASTAHAGGTGIALTRAVYVEKTIGAAPDGAKVREMPRSIARGDTLLFVVSYRNRGEEPAEDVVVVNPVPPTVSYAGCDEADALVSVDGGHSWGRLASLTVANPDGSARPAKLEDVTHVRWTFARAIGAGEAGEISFKGVVK